MANVGSVTGTRRTDDATRLSLAIVIASKNRPVEILQCLNSIVEQPTQPDEIIVVDQSTPQYDLPAIPNLKHIHDVALGGAAAARNRGVQASRADLVLFLDDDCELATDCAAGLQAAFASHPEAIGIQCRIAGDERANRWSPWQVRVSIFNRGFFNSSPIRRRNGIELRNANGIAAYRRRLFDHELLDERLAEYSLGEDWEFSRRALRYGKIWLCEQALVIHRLSPVNRYDKERYLMLRWQNDLYFYDKLQAQNYLPNRFWRIWWMVGQSISWIRLGKGLPSSAKAQAMLKKAANF